jgi:hypothetical protein
MTAETHRCIGYKILIAVVMKSSIFWDITPCRPVKADVLEEHTASVFRLKIKPSNKPELSRQQAKLGWIVKPEDGGDVFLRNVG